MKGWIIVPLVFLAGLLIGGVQPRSELRRLRKDLDTRKKVESTPAPQDRQLASFLNMLPMATPAHEPQPVRPEAGTNMADLAGSSTDSPTGSVAEAGGEKKWKELTPEERTAAFKAHMEQAAEVWRMRAEIARGAFASKTGFTEKEMTDFDVLMKSMNVRLEDLFVKTAEQLKAGETFTPETGIRLMNGLTESMVLTYDEMDRKLPATWRQDSGTSFDLVTYVDPVVVKPLVEVSDKLPGPGGPGRGRFGGGPFGGGRPPGGPAPQP
jgi:hypothetical protein